MIALSTLLCSGCQQDLVQHRVNKLTATVPDLYYSEVLDNLALTISNPEGLPYFGVPTQSAHTNARQYSASYLPGWDFVSSVHRYLFDKQGATLAGQIQNQATFQLSPVSNPDKLFIMQAAYQVAANCRRDPGTDLKLSQFYGQETFFFDYAPYIKSGWFCTTTSKREAYRNGAYVGHHDGTYVYVTREHIGDLTRFTLAILDIATLDTDVMYGFKQQKGAPGERALAPRTKPFPFPPPVFAAPMGAPL